MIRIALDMMGGDNAPSSIINGVINFLKEHKNGEVELHLVGSMLDNLKILMNEGWYSERGINSDKIIHDKYASIQLYKSTQIVDYKDRPSRIIKTKPNSSMNISINLLKEGIVDAVISAGNTGCLLASSFFNLGMIKGIKRPALFAFIPSENGNFLICDVGANSSAKPEHLLQFGKMASIYMKFQMKINQPKIGLSNIGSEENKGNELSKNSFNLLSENLENFIGNIESRYIFDGKTDIVLCDGFTGNIVLKLIEGMAQYNLNLISSKLKLDNNKIVKDIKKIYNYEQYGATPILGVEGLVFKSHGSSSEKGIKNAIKTAYKVSKINLIDKFKKSK